MLMINQNRKEKISINLLRDKERKWLMRRNSIDENDKSNKNAMHHLIYLRSLHIYSAIYYKIPLALCINNFC